jgi:hypothetical protein
MVKAECGCPCLRHLTTACSLPKALTVDLYVACAPCSPFSNARAERQVTHPSLHKDYNVLFGDHGSVISSLQVVLPHRWLSESVEGFGQAYSQSDCRTALQDLETAVSQISRADGSQHFTGFAILVVKGQIWINVKRVRFYPYLLILDLARYPT